MDRKNINNAQPGAIQCHFCKKFMHKHEAIEFMFSGKTFHADQACINREIINKDKIKSEKLTLTAIPFEEEFSANGRCYWCKELFKTAFDSPIAYVKDLPDQIVIDGKKHLIHQECLVAKKLMEIIADGGKKKEEFQVSGLTSFSSVSYAVDKRGRYQGSFIPDSFGAPITPLPKKKKQDPIDLKTRIANLMKKFPK